MKVMFACGGEHRAVGVADLAFDVLVVCLSPFDVEADEMEGVSWVAAAQFPKNEETDSDEQKGGDYGEG